MEKKNKIAVFNAHWMKQIRIFWCDSSKAVVELRVANNQEFEEREKENGEKERKSEQTSSRYGLAKQKQPGLLLDLCLISTHSLIQYRSFSVCFCVFVNTCILHL